MRPLIACLCILFFAVPASGCWEDGLSPDPGGIPISEAEISILFIGNSLTMSNDMTGMVAALLDSIGAGPAYVWQQAAPGTGPALTIAAGLSGEDALGFPHRFRTPSGQVVVISDVAAAHVKAAVAAVAAGISP